ncbi:MAG: CHASE domain-containing protein [Chloroflexi bacterium]|nr:CHASE domain-containing protein [Chloroflexota bacterium]
MATLGEIAADLRSRPREKRGERFTTRLPVLAAAATLAMLLAMTIGTTVALRSLMGAKSQGRFDEFAANASAVVGAEASRSLTEISAVEGFFSASDNVSENAFNNFALAMTRAGSAVKMLGYAPLDTEGPSGRFTVAHLYPTRPGLVTMGEDLSADSRFSAAIGRATETGGPATTGPIQASSGDPVGFLVFFPVYGKGQSDRVTVIGYAFGVYDLGEFLAEPLARAGIGSIKFRVIDLPSGAPAREIYPSPGGDSAALWAAGYKADSSLLLAGREWRLEFLSPPGYGLSPLEQQVWIIVMSAGLALTVVAAGSTYSLVASRRQVRLDLHLLTTQLSVILDAALESIVVTDRNGSVVWANGAFARNFGLGDARMLVGVPWRELWQRPGVEVAQRERFVAHMNEISANQSLAISSEDVDVTRPARRTLSLTSVPVADHAGTYLGRLWVYRDVTTERAADKAKSVFVSMVSHELRTPLTSVIGFLDLALDEERDRSAGKLSRYLDTARANADRLQRLVRDILDLSSLEAGGIRLDAGPVDVRELVTELVDSMDSEFGEHRLRASVDMPATVRPIRGDRGRLAQVLTNLLSNALRYTPAGGEVSVVVREQDGNIQISVRDTGVGIPKEFHEKIFERFVRVGVNGGAAPTGGTGLGLAITKTLVELHGGRISLDSTPGQGSTFTVSFPAHEEADPSTGPTAGAVDGTESPALVAPVPVGQRSAQ